MLPLFDSLYALLDGYLNKDIYRQQTSNLKTLEWQLSMLEYLNKMPNDLWLPFLNLTKIRD